jgi:hypothetical protein
MKILGQDVETHPEVPAPLPFRKFMVYIGPGRISVGVFGFGFAFYAA